MSYREVRLTGPRRRIVLAGQGYDIDYFGMDDGRSDDPTDAIRFVFQLGSGLMIYLYVVQAGAIGDLRHFGHSFWLSDCAAAHVDPKEYGPPASVEAEPMVLPRVHESVLIGDRTFAIASPTFRAPSEHDLEMVFELGDPGAREGRLRWSRRAAWQLEQGDAPPRALGTDERPRFGRGGEPNPEQGGP